MAKLDAGRRWPAWTPFAGAFVAYAALAVVLTFPLVVHLSSHVPVDLEDSLWYVTMLRWNADVTPLTGAWWNGFAFYPSTGTMAFSDHMLGASVIASPLQWLGLNPIAAYNVTFLASFVLCAIAAHALAFTLTRRHDAAAICGLAFGFSPYRLGHLAHLELLMAFGIPLALLALHGYLRTRRAASLALFSAALALQALSASYYALFFGVLLVMWMTWFLRPHMWRTAVAIVTAGAAAVVVLWPVIAGYSAIHQRHHLSRDVAEVLTYSADVTSLVTASEFSTLWGWTSALNGGERQLFPGLTVLVLVGVAAAATRRRAAPPRDHLSRASAICWAAAAAIAVWAVAAYARPYKPLSVAVALAIVATVLSRTARTAFRERSPLAFYLVAAAGLFLCSLGPRPSFLGEQVLYEPPYAWLMRLPLFADGAIPVPAVRVPARFGMLVALCLSVGAALAFARLAVSRRTAGALFAVAACGIIADGWVRNLPLRDPRAAVPAASTDNAAALMMLPLGDSKTDTASRHTNMPRVSNTR
jgi:hypothetical protein